MTKYIKYHKNYTEFGEPYQLVLPLNLEGLVPDDDSVRLLSHELEDLDYSLLYQVYADFACCLHLELLHSSLCFGNYDLVAIVVVSHFCTPFKIFILAERLKPLVNVILTLCSCLLVRKNRITARLQGSVLDFWQTPAKPCFIRWYVAWNEWEENMFLKIQEAVTLLNQEYLQAVRIKNDVPVLKGINVCTSPKVS